MALWPLLGEQRGHGVAVGDARLVQPCAGGQRAVEVLAPAGGEVVDDADVVAALEQGVDEVRADEAGPAGHERAHGAQP